MIQSVDRAIRMLLELQGARHLALSELAARLELSPSTTHGLLKTLVTRDLVRQDAQTQRYHLGPAVLRLAGVYLDALDLRTRALPWCRDLAVKTDAAVRVGVLSGTEVILVHHEPEPSRTARMAELGLGLPAHASALGKAILAFDESDPVSLWADDLTAMTSTTITSTYQLQVELSRIRATGTATENEEAVIGESSVAAPIFGSGNRVLAAIGVVMTSTNSDQLEHAANSVIAIANAISRELGADRLSRP